MSVSLALVVMMVFGGLADQDVEWQRFSSRWIAVLVLPVLLGWAWTREHEASEEPLGPRAGATPG